MNPRRITSASDLSRSLMGALACVSIGSMACASADLDERDLGSTSPQLTLSENPVSSDRRPVVGADGFVDPFIEGHWVGHAEDLFAAAGPDGQRPVYTFPSGSTEFTLDLELLDPRWRGPARHAGWRHLRLRLPRAVHARGHHPLPAREPLSGTPVPTPKRPSPAPNPNVSR
jgi:hypothetical protein